jgi:hypothetical protein
MVNAVTAAKDATKTYNQPFVFEVACKRSKAVPASAVLS